VGGCESCDLSAWVAVEEGCSMAIWFLAFHRSAIRGARRRWSPFQLQLQRPATSRSQSISREQRSRQPPRRARPLQNLRGNKGPNPRSRRGRRPCAGWNRAGVARSVGGIRLPLSKAVALRSARIRAGKYPPPTRSRTQRVLSCTQANFFRSRDPYVERRRDRRTPGEGDGYAIAVEGDPTIR
jgi:hypothetical protein